MHGSWYVPHKAEVSVAVTHNRESLRAQYPAESKNGEGVPKGSISMTSNSPRFILIVLFCLTTKNATLEGKFQV